MDERSRKLILPMLVAIVTLGLLVIGATFAYIRVGTDTTYGTNTIKTSIPLTGSASITSGTSISMTLTYDQVTNNSSEQTYYATSSGPNTNPNTQQIATIQGLIGTVDCTYTLNVKGSPADMAKNAVGLGQDLFVLTIQHFDGSGSEHTDTFDFHNSYTGSNQINSETGVNLTGKVTGISASNTKNIYAQLKYKNSPSVDQSKLANTSATFTFTVLFFYIKL